MVGHGEVVRLVPCRPYIPIPSNSAVLIQFKSVTVHQLSRPALKELMTCDEMFIDDNDIVVPIKCTSEKICNGVYKLHRKSTSEKNILGNLLTCARLQLVEYSTISGHSTKKPVTTMLTYPGNVQFYIVTTWETPGNHWC